MLLAIRQGGVLLLLCLTMSVPAFCPAQAKVGAKEAQNSGETLLQTAQNQLLDTSETDPAAAEGKYRKQRRRFTLGAFLSSLLIAGSWLWLMATLGSLTSLFALMLLSIGLGLFFLCLHLIMIRSFQIWRIRRTRLREQSKRETRPKADLP